MELIIKVEKPTSQTCFKKNFQKPELEWEDIYALPKSVTINANLCMFHYKLVHIIFYLNEMICKFRKKVSPLCSLCMKEPESPIHLFHSFPN